MVIVQNLYINVLCPLLVLLRRFEHILTWGTKENLICTHVGYTFAN